MPKVRVLCDFSMIAGDTQGAADTVYKELRRLGFEPHKGTRDMQHDIVVVEVDQVQCLSLKKGIELFLLSSDGKTGASFDLPMHTYISVDNF